MSRLNLKKYYQVLKLLSNGMYQTAIAEEMKISKQAVYKYIKRLVAWEFIAVDSTSLLTLQGRIKQYQILPKGRLALTRKRIGVNLLSVGKGDAPPIKLPQRWHNMGMRMKILTDNPGVRIGRVVKMQGWDKEINQKLVTTPYGSVTIERTPKHIFFFVPEREGISAPEMLKFITDVALLVHQALLKRHAILVDIFSRQVIRQEVAGTVNAKDLRKKMGVTKVMLGRKAKSVDSSIQPSQAWAGFDGSKGWEMETSDELWRQKFIMMPEIIVDTNNELQAFHETIKLHDKNILSHLAVVKSMDKGLVELNSNQKILGKILKKLEEKL